MKRFLAIALAVVMLITATALPAFAASDAVINLAVTTGGDTLTDGTAVAIRDTVEVEYTLSNVTDGAEVSYTVSFHSAFMSFASATFNGTDVTTDVVTNADYTVSYTATASGSSAFCVVLTAQYATDENTALSIMKYLDIKVTVDGDEVTGISEPSQGWDTTFTITDPDNGTTDSDTSAGGSEIVDNDNIDSTPHASIPVIGYLDSDGDGIPDKTDEVKDPTIDVCVYWTDMVFNYTYKWNYETLAEEWYWINGEDSIKVENRSDVDVNAAISFAGAGDYNDDAVGFTEGELIGATWVDNVLSLEHGNQIADYADADTDNDGVVAPSGTLNVNVAAGVTMDTGDDAEKQVTLGYITVNISVAEVVIPEFPTDETLWVWGAEDNDSADNPAVYTVKAGTTYTIGYIDGIEKFTLAVHFTDSNGETVTDVTIGEQVEETVQGTYYMSRTFTCDESLVGQTVNLRLELDGYDVNWYYTLHVVE